MNALYEALLTRDLDRAGELVMKECRESGAEAMRDSIMRFSVLAFSPSLHSRGAVYAALAVADVFDRFEDQSSLLVECARYVGESRIPWSEAPVTEPPRVGEDQSTGDSAIDEAINSEDLHAAERWLAGLLQEEAPAGRFFDAASRHPGDEGYGFTTAVVSWRIAEHFPSAVRYAVLRMALLEWLNARQTPDSSRLAGEEAIAATIGGYVRSGGQPHRFPALLVLDATHAAAKLTSSPGRYEPLFERFASIDTSERGNVPERRWKQDDLAYRYAADYGFFVQSVPLAERLMEVTRDRESCESIPDAAHHFLMSSEGFEEWSFA